MAKDRFVRSNALNIYIHQGRVFEVNFSVATFCVLIYCYYLCHVCCRMYVTYLDVMVVVHKKRTFASWSSATVRMNFVSCHTLHSAAAKVQSSEFDRSCVNGRKKITVL